MYFVPGGLPLPIIEVRENRGKGKWKIREKGI